MVNDYWMDLVDKGVNADEGEFTEYAIDQAGFQVDAYLMALSANQIKAEKNSANQSANWSAST